VIVSSFPFSHVLVLSEGTGLLLSPLSALFFEVYKPHLPPPSPQQLCGGLFFFFFFFPLFSYGSSIAHQTPSDTSFPTPFLLQSPPLHVSASPSLLRNHVPFSVFSLTRPPARSERGAPPPPRWIPIDLIPPHSFLLFQTPRFWRWRSFYPRVLVSLKSSLFVSRFFIVLVLVGPFYLVLVYSLYSKNVPFKTAFLFIFILFPGLPPDLRFARR